MHRFIWSGMGTSREMPHPSILRATHSRCWSVTHRPWAACMCECVHVTCVLRTVLLWGGGQDSWGREALWISRPEESVWDEAQLWDRQKTGSYQIHTHTHTHKCVPPAAFSWPASPIPHRNICLKIYVSSFNKNVGGVSPAAIVSHYAKWKRLAKTHENVCKCTVLHAQVRHSSRNPTVTQLLTGNNAQQMKCGFTTHHFCNVSHFRNTLWIPKKIKRVYHYILGTYISENNILNQSKLVWWS